MKQSRHLRANKHRRHSVCLPGICLTRSQTERQSLLSTRE
jgi:hypothetical protein